MSTLTSFINPPIDSTSTSTRILDKSISVIDALILGSEEAENDMSYKPSDLTLMKQYSTSHIESIKTSYEDLITCSVCYDQFESVSTSKLPKLLPCQHTYCVECIYKLLDCSNEPGSIECPQCKLKFQDFNRNPLDLPTSRIVISLLEKEALNYQGYASCPGCRQKRNLEVCFHCDLPLCNQCTAKHFDSWRDDEYTKCLTSEESLAEYKRRLDSIDLYTTQNFENAEAIKNEIDEAYNLILQRLNTEKDYLLRTVNQIKDENIKYVQFKKEVLTLMNSFKAFRETNEMYEKKTMANRKKKIESHYNELEKIHQQYSKLSSLPFKIAERFERRQISETESSYLGSLLVNELNLERTTQLSKPRIATSQSTPKLSSSNRDSTFPRVAPTAPLQVNSTLMRNSASFSASTTITPTQESNLKLIEPAPSLTSWTVTSSVKPHSETTIQNVPTLMTSFEDILFCMDNSSNLLMFERKNIELKFQHSCKLNVPNPKGISVNKSYFAISYSGILKKDQMKGKWKTLSPNGVMLFSRQDFIVCSEYDKLIELKNGDSFKQPSGIALTDRHAYVCDKELRSVFKFDLKSDSKGAVLLEKISLNSSPCSISVNNELIVLTDMNSIFYVYDADTCQQRTSKNLNSIDKLHGYMSIVLSEDNLIFVRNSFSQLYLLDANLEMKASFNEIQGSIQNIALLQANRQMLVVGSNNGQQSKLFGYQI